MREKFCNEVLQKLDERFPDLDHSFLGLAGALANAYHLLSSIVERGFADFGITPQSVDVLVVLWVRKGQGSTLGEIGEVLGVSAANITGLVEGLVRKGLVNRCEHPEDRRKRVAELTERGNAFMEAFLPECSHFLQTVFAPFTLEARRQLQEGLTRLADFLWSCRENRTVMRIEPGKTTPDGSLEA